MCVCVCVLRRILRDICNKDASAMHHNNTHTLAHVHADVRWQLLHVGPRYVFRAQFHKHFLVHRLEQGFKDNLHIEYMQL